MEIKVTSDTSLAAFKAFARASTFRRFNPKKCLIAFAAVWLLLLAATIGLILIGVPASECIWLLILLALAAFMWLYIYFGLPIIMYKSQQQLRNMKTEFTFKDNEILISGTNGLISDEGVISYLAVTKVIETSSYFFIFINKISAYIIDKSAITEENIYNIRAKLSSVQSVKYILCKY